MVSKTNKVLAGGVVFGSFFMVRLLVVLEFEIKLEYNDQKLGLYV